MHKRTFGVLLGALLVLSLGVLGCSATQLLASQSSATVTPTRTPRPTWTPVAGSVRIATPTLDATRFPGVVLPTAAQATPMPFVPGSGQSIFVPQSQPGGPAVQTVVVIIVTATPTPTTTPTIGPFVPPAKPTITPTPGPPTATPLPTGTPLPPVYVVTKEASQRASGAGRGLSCRDAAGCGDASHGGWAQSSGGLVEGLLRQRRRCLDFRLAGARRWSTLDGGRGSECPAATATAADGSSYAYYCADTDLCVAVPG